MGLVKMGLLNLNTTLDAVQQQKSHRLRLKGFPPNRLGFALCPVSPPQLYRGTMEMFSQANKNVLNFSV
jgi:hypothetical protein